MDVKLLDEIAEVVHSNRLAMLSLQMGALQNPYRLIFSVGGYVAPLATWRTFTQAWHIMELGSECQVIRKHRLMGVNRTLVVSDFRDNLDQKTLLNARRDISFVFCLRRCMEWIAHYWSLDRHAREQIAIIFESGTPGLGTAMEYFGYLCESQWGRQVFASFTTMRKCIPPLVSADILAYAMYQEAEREELGLPKEPRSMLCLDGLINVQHVGPMTQEAIIKVLCDNPT